MPTSSTDKWLSGVSDPLSRIALGASSTAHHKLHVRELYTATGEGSLEIQPPATVMDRHAGASNAKPAVVLLDLDRVVEDTGIILKTLYCFQN